MTSDNSSHQAEFCEAVASQRFSVSSTQLCGGCYPETLFAVVRTRGETVQEGFNYREYVCMRTNSQVAELTAFSPLRLNVSIDNGLEPAVDGQMVSGNYFSLLGVSAAAGRTISVDDDRVPNGHPVAMVSYGYWRRRFGMAPATIGRKMLISGAPFTIIGITPREFFGAEVGTARDTFVPLMMKPAVEPVFQNLIENPIINRPWCIALARLGREASPQPAAAALQVLYRQATPPVPPALAARGVIDWTISLKPAATGLSNLRRQFSEALFILMMVVGSVLLIACANLANLLLARAAGRRPELAMRLALGAGRSRLIRHLVAESLSLSIAGGLCGILLAGWMTRLLVTYMSTGRATIALDLKPDLRVLSFTAAASIVTGLLFGLAPALRSTRIDLTTALKGLGNASSARGGLRVGKMLVVLQVAASLVLVIGALLFVRSLKNLNGPESGNRQSVVMMRVEPRGSDQRNIPGTTRRLDAIYRDLIGRAAAIPGVRSVGMSQVTPTNPEPNAGQMIRFASGEEASVRVVMIYPSYFSTAGIPVIAGREFNDSDLGEDSPAVCVVNETFARQLYPAENPIGKPCVVSRRPRTNDINGARYGDTPFRTKSLA